MLNPGTLASELAGSEEIRIPEGMKIFFGSPLTFWNVGLHELIKDLMSLERRSDLEKLLGDFLHMELEGEFQWLRKHYLHEDCKGAGSIAADPKALDAIMITLTAAKARSKAQSMEIENLPRRISSLQTLFLHLGIKEDNQVVRDLAEVTAQDSSSMKVLYTQNEKSIVLTKV
ncbi:hypothetical protein MMC34_006565 [Xylographa carneopallida]|nr:hypothetical protein [Xylographa carneopallida]